MQTDLCLVTQYQINRLSDRILIIDSLLQRDQPVSDIDSSVRIVAVGSGVNSVQVYSLGSQKWVHVGHMKGWAH